MPSFAKRCALGLLAAPLALGGCAGTWAKQKDLIRSLDHEVVALQMQNEQLQEQLLTCDQGEPRGSNLLYTELRQIFADRNIGVDVDGHTVRVVVPGSELLNREGLEVRDEARWVLDLLSTALALHDDHVVDVIVHTSDAAPSRSIARSFPDNWAVSAAGAAAIARVLVTDFGVAAARVSAAGRAGAEPISDNSTTEGREANHRVVFLLHPQGTL